MYLISDEGNNMVHLKNLSWFGNSAAFSANLGPQDPTMGVRDAAYRLATATDKEFKKLHCTQFWKPATHTDFLPDHFRSGLV